MRDQLEMGPAGTRLPGLGSAHGVMCWVQLERGIFFFNIFAIILNAEGVVELQKLSNMATI